MGGRRAWVVWGTGVVAYLIAVTQRTSFGVAGLEATERYSAGASALSIFTVVQLLVYAALQIPVGVLVDRVGPRLLILAGAVLMALGQVQLALSETVGAGIAGRLLVGAGDALTFISVLRLLPAWFESRRIPVLTQLTGIIGQLGQVVSVVPFAALLGAAGWSTAFLSAAGLSALAVVLAVAVIRDAPQRQPRAKTGLRQTGISLAQAWRQPGTRLGLWSHFTVQFPGTVFVLIWGYPYLVRAEGVDPVGASALMTLFVAVGIVSGPMLGLYVSRHPLRRSTMVLAIASGIAGCWLAVLLASGPAPLWLLTLLIVALALGGPGSMIAFDFARTFNPSSRMGTATGIVNIGGFVASLVAMYGIGVILDVLYARGLSGDDLYALGSFRIAMAFQLVILAAGAAAILIVRRTVRRRMAEQGVVVPPLREVLARERARRRAARSEGTNEGNSA
ncbi:MFS transporter [Arthrobacter crusticola]|uniref:Lysosomal dipeptide transporter MFSD1 n=1 Tax=Arthrobacter crusticola TaxID=2547960 RepID=A0A4R5TNT5_9MICC|nr:MFS transporter [Arthrobacter crusticola]TDK24053.1 MFS transporter [Arthrobacter crusticola]